MNSNRKVKTQTKRQIIEQENTRTNKRLSRVRKRIPGNGLYCSYKRGVALLTKGGGGGFGGRPVDLTRARAALALSIRFAACPPSDGTNSKPL